MEIRPACWWLLGGGCGVSPHVLVVTGRRVRKAALRVGGDSAGGVEMRPTCWWLLSKRDSQRAPLVVLIQGEEWRILGSHREDLGQYHGQILNQL